MSDKRDAESLMEALRAWTGAFSEFGRRFGAEAGMHVTDSDALIHVINAEDQGAPLTQAQLSRRIGLSTGATSSLLNRLEEAGHVERRRDSKDRRAVTIRSTTAVHERVETFFADVGTEMSALLGQYSAGVLAQFTDAIRGMTSVMDRHLANSVSTSPTKGALKRVIAE